MKCKYTYNGNNLGNLTIDELFLYLDGLSISFNDIEDIIFSADLESSRQTSLENALTLLKNTQDDTYVVNTGFDEDGGFRGENGEFSICEFFDNSGEAILNGKRLCDPVDRNQYKIHRTVLLLNEGKTLDLALLLVEQELNKWDVIIKFSLSLHKIGISKYIGGTNETVRERKLNFIEQAKDIIGSSLSVSDEFLGNLFDLLENRFYIPTKGFWSESKCFRGINITSKIKNSGTKLFGHIDYAIIDKKGTLHIYNFKVSHLSLVDWSDLKKERYLLELAFIKQMLADNNIDIGGITLHEIPIKIGFSPDFSQVISSNIYPDGIEYNSYYDNIARYFIKPERVSFVDPSDEEMKNNHDIYDAIFPDLQIENEGIKNSVLDWIKRAPAFGEEQPITIREINDGEHSYVVTIEGVPHLISNHRKKENNKEIIELISKYISDLNINLPNKANSIADCIQHSFDRNLEYFDFSKLKEGKSYLNVKLKKYIDNEIRQTSSGAEIREYKWKFIDNLVSCGILLFKNNDTGQLDVIVLSTENLNQSPKYSYGNNILGGYVTDRDFLWRGTYGNVQTVRGIVMLNSIIPKLLESGIDFELGDIKVISLLGMTYEYNIEHIVKNYMKDIYKTIKAKNPSLNVQSNFGKVKYVDYFSNLVKTFLVITNNDYGTTKILKDLASERFNIPVDSNEHKRAALLSIMESFQELFPEIANDPLLTLRDSNKYLRDLAKFYILLSLAYLYYSNERLSYEEELTLVDKRLYTSPTIPNLNINIVVTNLQTTIDSISEECDSEFSKNIYPMLLEFYKDAGYTSLENFTLGTQNRLFTNLFLTDSKGNRLLIFKNPYTDNSLKAYEKKFLKKALFYFNKYRFRDEDNKNFTSSDDPEIPKYILTHGDYLNVPLKRASTSTHRQRLSIKDKVDSCRRILRSIIKTKGENLYDEFVSGLTEDEAEYYRSGLESMRFKDPFNRTDELRKEYIEKNGINYFETNVEDLLIERLFNSIYTEKINRMLLGTKALLLLMSILGENSGSDKNFEDELKFIKEYIGLHVFKKSINEKGISLKIVGAGQGLRKAVTFLNIAGNVISAARDVENGFMENYIRTASKYMTDISAENLTKAYAYVVKNGSMDAMKMTLLSKLCVRYRLSNTDTARITERLKTNRQGLSNWDNVAYSTLRAPDFLNRMSLFIARAMQDGVLDAWEVKDGELVYNWKKDKRFSLLTNKANKNNPEYKKQQALYMLHIRDWNNDHPDPNLQLTYDDDLPTPYSNLEILAIKQVAENIYGSYDRMTRSMGDFTAIGMFFGMYTTWMNGIWNNWMMKPGKYNVKKMTEELDTDIDGNLLFQNPDTSIIYTEITQEDGTKKYINQDNGEEISKEELVPLLKHVPVPVQGIIYTLRGASKILQKDGLDAAIKYITEDPNTLNSMKQLAITMVLGMLFALLFRFILDPAYEETKKGYKDMQSINIIMTELAYRPLSPATDSLYGILNVIKYLGDGTDPPVYNVPTKFVSDLSKTVFGEKTAGQFISGNFAFARIFKQLANAKA